MRFIGGPSDKNYEKKYKNPEKYNRKAKKAKEDQFSDEEEEDLVIQTKVGQPSQGKRITMTSVLNN